MKGYSVSDRLRVATACVLACVSVVLATASARAQAVTVEYARGRNAIVASFTEVLGELRNADPGPSVTIYGDGRAVVHYPRYMKQAGDYELRLAPAEMDRMVAQVGQSVVEFDEQAARQGKRQEAGRRAAGGPASLTIVADASTSVFEVHLDRYRPAGGAEIANVRKKVAWSGLRNDASQYRSVTPLQQLAGAEEAFRALMQRPDLAKIP